MPRIQHKQTEVDSALRMMLGHECGDKLRVWHCFCFVSLLLAAVFILRHIIDGNIQGNFGDTEGCSLGKEAAQLILYSLMYMTCCRAHASSDSSNTLLVAKPRAVAAKQKAQGLEEMHLG